MRTRLLIIFIILTLFPLSLNGIVTYKHFSSTMDRKTEQYTVDIVRQINANLDWLFKDMQRLSLMPLYDQQVLSILKKYDGDTDSTVWASSDDYQKMKLYTSAQSYNRKEIKGIHLVSNSGVFFSNNDSMAVTSVWDSSQDEWFDEVEQSDGNWILIPQHQPSYYNEKSKATVVSVARVLREPNSLERLGVIIIDIHLSAFQTLLNNLDFESNANLIMIDRKQRLIFEQKNGEGFPSYQDLLAQDFGIVANQAQGNHNLNISNGSRKISLNGESYMLVMHDSAFTGLSVISLVPTIEIQKESLELGKFTLWFAVICVIVVALLSVWLAYNLARPLIDLKQKMVRVEQGKFDQRITELYNDELGQLGRGFNKMMDEIDRLFKEVYLLGIREKEAELAALQSQIHPHFIYNTLESISMLAIRKNASEVSDMVSALGRLLRYTIDRADRLVPLYEELHFVQSYVQIQQMRFGERLQVEYDIADDVESFMVPKLLIQPLVENAIHHGIDPRPEGGKIWISTVRFEQELLITVRDDGVGMNEDEMASLNRAIREQPSAQSWQSKHGLGLSNIYQRILFIYGEQGDMSIDGSPGGGVAVTVTIPIHD